MAGGGDLRTLCSPHGRGYALVREVMVAGLGSAGAVAEELFSSVGFNVGGYYGGIVAEIVFELVFNFSCY